MEEGTSAQPFKAPCDELVALISSSISDSEELVFLKSSELHSSWKTLPSFKALPSVMERSLRTQPGQNDPKLLAVLCPAGTKFPVAQKLLCLPWSSNCHVFMEQDQGDLGFACLPGCSELCSCAPLSSGGATRKELFLSAWGVIVSIFFPSVDLSPPP